MGDKSGSFKQKIQENSRFTKKFNNHEQNISWEFDHQQSIEYPEDNDLLDLKSELSIFSDQKDCNQQFCPQNCLSSYIGENSETNDDDQGHFYKNDVILMSDIKNFLRNQGTNRQEMIESKAQKVLGFTQDQSIDQCDCRCEIQEEMCQRCNCWLYCAHLRRKNAQKMTPQVPEGNSYACFNEEKFNADYDEVTKQEISMEEEESHSTSLSSMIDESDQITSQESSSNQPRYRIGQEINSYINQSESNHGHSHSSEGSCRCKNKDCADGRCVCRKGGKMCGPECGCIHEACKNRGKVPQIQFVPRRKQLIQAIMDQQQLRQSLEDMGFEDFQYSY